MIHFANQSGQGMPETVSAKRFNFIINNQYKVKNVEINKDGTIFESQTPSQCRVVARTCINTLDESIV